MDKLKTSALAYCCRWSLTSSFASTRQSSPKRKELLDQSSPTLIGEDPGATSNSEHVRDWKGEEVVLRNKSRRLNIVIGSAFGSIRFLPERAVLRLEWFLRYTMESL